MPLDKCGFTNIAQETFILAFSNSRELNFTNFGIVFVNMISRKGIRLSLLS